MKCGVKQGVESMKYGVEQGVCWGISRFKVFKVDCDA